MPDKPDSERQFRPDPEDPRLWIKGEAPDWASPAEVLDTIRYLVGSDAPFPEHRPLGEWECGNGDCAVRAVTIRAKTAGAPEGFPPDILHCPACQLPLTFRRWLREKTLIPADRVPSQIV